MSSAKSDVIAAIFDARFDPTSGTLHHDLVTFDDLTDAIRQTGAGLSTSNVANFWKDIVRRNPNGYWPTSVFARGFTGEDAAGTAPRASFRFVPVADGATTPFPEATRPPGHLLDDPHVLPSLTLPLVAREFGRPGENWIAQVASQLGVVSYHFAVASPLDPPAREVAFVQTGVRLRKGEVDALFRLIDADGRRWMVAAEIKGRKDEVWEHQVRRSAEALHETCRDDLDLAGVIPLAVKVQERPKDRSILHVVEYAPYRAGGGALPVTAESVVELRPAVPGV